MLGKGGGGDKIIKFSEVLAVLPIVSNFIEYSESLQLIDGIRGKSIDSGNRESTRAHNLMSTRRRLRFLIVYRTKRRENSSLIYERKEHLTQMLECYLVEGCRARLR
jgi:hypothetical protein